MPQRHAPASEKKKLRRRQLRLLIVMSISYFYIPISGTISTCTEKSEATIGTCLVCYLHGKQSSVVLSELLNALAYELPMKIRWQRPVVYNGWLHLLLLQIYPAVNKLLPMPMQQMLYWHKSHLLLEGWFLQQ